MIDRTQRRVVCAAVLYDDDTLIIGPRHHDTTMHKMCERDTSPGQEVEQGFIDQHGVFMDRKEALAVALAAGQRIYRCGGDETALYSENLY